MTFSTDHLFEELISMTKDLLNRVEVIKENSTETLNAKPGPESWSALECIEHLNHYGYFYIPEIGKQLKNDKKNPPVEEFKSGILGEYFAQSMLPKAKLNKMKTFKSMNPAGSQLDKSTLQTFSDQQRQILDLLEQARKVNIQKIKTGISISKFIKLRLGDTFRVVIYHNLRHVEQAERALQLQPTP